jgi:hypothetical protein
MWPPSVRLSVINKGWRFQMAGRNMHRGDMSSFFIFWSMRSRRERPDISKQRGPATTRRRAERTPGLTESSRLNTSSSTVISVIFLSGSCDVEESIHYTRSIPVPLFLTVTVSFLVSFLPPGTSGSSFRAYSDDYSAGMEYERITVIRVFLSGVFVQARFLRLFLFFYFWNQDSYVYNRMLR